MESAYWGQGCIRDGEYVRAVQKEDEPRKITRSNVL